MASRQAKYSKSNKAGSDNSVFAIGFSKCGGPEVLKVLDLPNLTPGPSDIVIEMKAIGLNFADIYRRKGEYAVEGESPFVLGYEGAGIVIDAGSDVEGVRNGDRVGFVHVPRSNAEFVLAPAWKVFKLPDSLSFEIGASLLQSLTSHFLTHDSYQVKRGDQVLIHSGAGGVGSILIQLCKYLGATVITTVSSEDKVKFVKELGADHVITRNKNDWLRGVLELTHGLGVDVAYDSIGTTLKKSLAVTKVRGTTVYFGWSGGPPPHVDPTLLMDDSKKLVGGDLWSHIQNRDDLMLRAHFIFELIQKEQLKINISKRFKLSDLALAHQELESGHTSGKIILTTQGGVNILGPESF